MNKRPVLKKHLSVNDFRAFYWLKNELILFCQQEGLSRTGSKIELANRIAYFLETGAKPPPQRKEKPASTSIKSKFNWNTDLLTLNTIITDNYKNTENVRVFFATQLGKRFKFNVRFMNWMKSNEGKTLGDAVAAWQQITAQKKQDKSPKDIAPQFEYNRYLRDFLADNPAKDRAIGIALWKIKKSMRGDNVYTPSDLNFLEEKSFG